MSTSNPYAALGQVLPADLLKLILGGQSVNGYEMGPGNYVGPQPTESNDQTGNPANFERVIYQADPATTGMTARWNTWNPDGTYRGAGTGPGQTVDDIIMAATGALMGGAVAGMGSGSTSAGLSASEKAAMMAANGMNDAEIAAALGGQAGADLTTGTLAGGAVSQAVDAASKMGSAKSLLDSVDGRTLATVAGAVAGAADSGDKEQTSSRDPWAPAQPYLKGLLSEGADLYNKLKAQPFSPAQQAGYANMGQILDLVNNNAAGLLGGFQQNASGANQFVRGQQRGLLGSNFQPTADQWRPQNFWDLGARKG